jgi:hypothetical protein
MKSLLIITLSLGIVGCSKLSKNNSESKHLLTEKSKYPLCTYTLTKGVATVEGITNTTYQLLFFPGQYYFTVEQDNTLNIGQELKVKRRELINGHDECRKTQYLIVQ